MQKYGGGRGGGGLQNNLYIVFSRCLPNKECERGNSTVRSCKTLANIGGSIRVKGATQGVFPINNFMSHKIHLSN